MKVQGYHLQLEGTKAATDSMVEAFIFFMRAEKDPGHRPYKS